ncbi:unnamed protein product [Didymodactylos carnosus]|uniref:Uncharacterized protein n=1 Tax=Didymodactylos carnosus TaxID=1234261 RepID=A0A813S6S0_9BILA|nr:unnamed protein product [Didymodactylos carnosus]CAF0791862.1 unnamed protein product [Didymodactylos carnosus]CAF3492696.1 unnamed protein product [Didymodactylos carnosus]CAF3576075.1 unnamed protein product [Didymodactylos carnosus]
MFYLYSIDTSTKFYYFISLLPFIWFSTTLNKVVYSYSVYSPSSKLKQQSLNHIENDYTPTCKHHAIAIDQAHYGEYGRKKRFFLFPEIKQWKNDWRYIYNPSEIRFWISNFYPNKISTNILKTYIRKIVYHINEVLDDDQQIRIKEATNAGDANFNIAFFKYHICPKNDPEAQWNNVTMKWPIDIYTEEVAFENQYRAHGGIRLGENGSNSTKNNIAITKFNAKHTFIYTEDYLSDPILNHCDANENCKLDLYWALLHESLHGFGIEHTANHDSPQLPNLDMKAVMHVTIFRVMCHDDIRAIRKVYGYTVIREHAKYDDTCRRDFPLSKREMLMQKIKKSLFLFILISIMISFLVFILTIIYILCRNTSCCEFKTSKGNQKTKSEQSSLRYVENAHQSAPEQGARAFLWHDELF